MSLRKPLLAPMDAEDDFAIWLGRLGHGRAAGFRGRLKRALNLAGRGTGGRRARRFTGVRIGRAAGVGAMLSGRVAGPARRRVVVKASIVRLGGRGLARAAAHLRYLQRDGTTREGERGQLYGPDSDSASRKDFLERARDDRHQFRFIVAPEDGPQYDELKPLVRRLMTDAERDLGTRLDWIAVDHFNTGHPHAHIVVRGKDETGRDLVIARNYLTHGLRERAGALVELDLGPRTERDLMQSRLAEISAERWTPLDRALAEIAKRDGVVGPVHSSAIEQSLRAGRLQALARLGLANEESRGRWRLARDLEPRLRALSRRGDIIRTMSRLVAGEEDEPGSRTFDIVSEGDRLVAPLVGRVIGRGLADEHADQQFLAVDGLDGRLRYLSIGTGDGVEAAEGDTIRIASREIAVRASDRRIAEIASANGGRYTPELHREGDAGATIAFTTAHVRRLEAIRRSTGNVTRLGDGSWQVGPDYLTAALDHETRAAARAPMVVDRLATAAPEILARHEGLTWLDMELESGKRVDGSGPFASAAARALRLRLQWLAREGLTDEGRDGPRVKRGLVETLRARELVRTAAQLSRELGLDYVESRSGMRVEGRYVRPVAIGDRRYALIERARDFTLVPWKPVLEQAKGRQVAARIGARTIDWQIGRARGLDIS